MDSTIFLPQSDQFTAINEFCDILGQQLLQHGIDQLCQIGQQCWISIDACHVFDVLWSERIIIIIIIIIIIMKLLNFLINFQFNVHWEYCC